MFQIDDAGKTSNRLAVIEKGCHRASDLQALAIFKH